MDFGSSTYVYIYVCRYANIHYKFLQKATFKKVRQSFHRALQASAGGKNQTETSVYFNYFVNSGSGGCRTNQKLRGHRTNRTTSGLTKIEIVYGHVLHYYTQKLCNICFFLILQHSIKDFKRLKFLM